MVHEANTYFMKIRNGGALLCNSSVGSKHVVDSRLAGQLAVVVIIPQPHDDSDLLSSYNIIHSL